MIHKIEIDFALPVEPTDTDYRDLDRIVDRICKANRPEGWLHWPCGMGSKPSFSSVDAALLGKPGSFDPSIPSGSEPEWDDSVFSIDCSAREAYPEEIERDEARKQSRERWRASPEWRVADWVDYCADAGMRLLRRFYRWRSALLVFVVLPLQAATFTTIEPPPLPEGDTLAIVQAHCPTCTRVSDDLDIDFNAATGYFVFAFEDWDLGYGPRNTDRDFNDFVVSYDFDTDELTVLAEYSAATHAWGFDGQYVFASILSGPSWTSTAWSAPWLNRDGLDRMVTWRLPADLPAEVPEPGTLGVLLIGLLIWRKR